MKRQGRSCLMITVAIFLLTLNRCKPDHKDPGDPSTPIGTPYKLEVPQGFPDPNIPADNPLTVEGIRLGRFLFYEKKLSRDMTMSCGSCHLQGIAMSDPEPKSTGIRGMQTRRHAMVLFNLAFQEKFFWDGRAMSLEQQAIMPILDPVELDNDIATVISRLETDLLYPPLFKAAFGSEAVTEERIAKAIAQFERTIISANSEYDSVIRMGLKADFGPSKFTDGNPRSGMNLFNSERGDCFHCHGGKNTQYLFGAFGVDDQFKNNGLNPNHSKDVGLGAVTNNPFDDGKFKVPSLRNVWYSKPYMHNGSIAELADVIEFYNSGVNIESPNLSSDMTHNNGGVIRNWEPWEKKDLLAFLGTLVDFKLLRDTNYSDPFQ